MEFSLGVSRAKLVKYGPRDINGCKIKAKAKTKAKVKVKAKVKSKNLQSFGKQSNNKMHMGPFWHLPRALEVSDSVNYKFSIISHICSYSKLKDTIASNIRSIRFNFTKTSATGWIYKPSPAIKSQIRAYYAKQELEWNTVRGLYLCIFKTKRLLSPLIYKWRIAQCLRRVKNTEDPVTLEVPKKLVRIIDFANKISFVYEANTIRRAIENRILLSDYMFAEPQDPVNLLTNLPLTYAQLMSVIFQCKTLGEYSWILEELKNRNCSLAKFILYNSRRINIEAIRAFFKKSNRIIMDTVIDFLRLEADYAEMASHKVVSFILAYDSVPENITVRKWINHTRDWYIAKELNNPELLKRIDIETEILLDAIYKEF
uniref:Uncharacterized protein n=1 Tax=viral metagenome TaxID=1070528 RepID=A0A6C0ANL6_9ZZZZ